MQDDVRLTVVFHFDGVLGEESKVEVALVWLLRARAVLTEPEQRISTDVRAERGSLASCLGRAASG
jgi:hypothetical protein